MLLSFPLRNKYLKLSKANLINFTLTAIKNGILFLSVLGFLLFMLLGLMSNLGPWKAGQKFQGVIVTKDTQEVILSKHIMSNRSRLKGYYRILTVRLNNGHLVKVKFYRPMPVHRDENSYPLGQVVVVKEMINPIGMKRYLYVP